MQPSFTGIGLYVIEESGWTMRVACMLGASVLTWQLRHPADFLWTSPSSWRAGAAGVRTCV
jgi:hypothetical protein